MKGMTRRKKRIRTNKLLFLLLAVIILGSCFPKELSAAENTVNIISDEVLSEDTSSDDSQNTDLIIGDEPAGGVTETDTEEAVNGDGPAVNSEESAVVTVTETETETDTDTESDTDTDENASDPEAQGGNVTEAPTDENASDGEAQNGYVTEAPFVNDEAEEVSSLQESRAYPSMVISGSFVTQDKDVLLEYLNAIRLEACEKGYPFYEKGTLRYLTAEDYVPLKWSYDLDEIARQRAAEASVFTAHYRLNDTSCFTVSSTAGIYSYAENLAWNENGIICGIDQWRDEETAYLAQEGQDGEEEIGHYRCLINPSYKRMAISAFRRNGDNYYYSVCQEFSTKELENEEEVGLKGKADVIAPVAATDIKKLYWKSGVSVIERGETGEFTVKGETYNIYPHFNYGEVKLNSIVYNLNWSSTNEDILAVTGDGTVNAISPGSSILKASTGYIYVSREVNVWVALEDVSLKGELQEDGTLLYELNRGESVSLFEDYIPLETTERELTWKSSAAGICSVNNRGVVTGRKSGKAVISCKSAAGTKTVTVNVIPVLESLSLSKTALSYSLDRTPKKLKLTVKYLPADAYSDEDKKLKWESTDPGIAQVDESTGIVTFGSSKGSCTLTATSENTGVSASCSVELYRDYKRCGLEISTKELTLGDDYDQEGTAVCVMDPDLVSGDASEIEWSSSSPALILSKTSGFDVSSFSETEASEDISTYIKGVSRVYFKARNIGMLSPLNVTLTVRLRNDRSAVKLKLIPAEGFCRDAYGEKRLYGPSGKGVKGWKLNYSDGEGEPANYFFDAKGRMATGQLKISGAWYRFDEEGRQIISQGWTEDKQHYYDEKGAALTGWQNIDGSWHYFDGSGARQTEWVEVKEKTYYLDPDQGLVTGWLGDEYLEETGKNPAAGLGARKRGIARVTISGSENTACFGKDGLIRGELRKEGSSWYYFDDEGKAVGMSLTPQDKEGTLAAEVNKKGALGKFIFTAEGKSSNFTGWALLGSDKLYLKSGVIRTGLVKIDGLYYFFHRTLGTLQTGGVVDGKVSYYTAPNGRVISKSGLTKTADTLFYYNPETGYPMEGLKYLSGKWYYFHTDGSLHNEPISDASSGLTFQYDGGILKKVVYSSTLNMGMGGVVPADGYFTLDSGERMYFVKGMPKTGWVDTGSGAFHFFSPLNGLELRDFTRIGKSLYYLDENTGVRYGSGWKEIDGRYYWFDAKGVCARGKKKLTCRPDDPTALLTEKYDYYFDPEDGHLYTDCCVLGSWKADQYGKLR